MIRIPDDVAEMAYTNVDWEAARRVLRKQPGSPLESLRQLFAWYRRRRRPALMYDSAYVLALRRAATRAQVAEASENIRKACSEPQVTGQHTTAIGRLGADCIFLGITADIGWLMAQTAVRQRDTWAKGAWGTTRSLAELMSWMLLCPEVDPVCLIPFGAWLTEQSKAEWAWAKRWDEAMLGSSGHNWWLHTFIGFFEAGLWFPEFACLRSFRALCPEYFEREINLLFEPDGFTRERSGYQWGTASHIYDLLQLAEANGIKFSDAFYERARAIASAEWKVMPPDGSFPLMGDSGGRHVADHSLNRLRAISAMFNMPEGKYVAEHLSLRWKPPYKGFLPSWGRNRLAAYRRLRSRAPALPDTCLPDSRYYFMRSGWSRNSDWLSIEAGPVGNVVTSHDHTHCFNIELYSRGTPILVDNGSGPYGDSPARMWRESSAAHNVATVDGQDHAEIENEWRWRSVVLPHVNEWISRRDFAYFNGAHEGYRRLRHGIASARRIVFYRRGLYWVLIDRFTPETEAEHEYEIHFHLAKPAALGPGGRCATTSKLGNLAIIPVDPEFWTASCEPCPHPLDGYHNPDHLSYKRRVSGRTLMACLLVPFEGSRMPEIRVGRIPILCDGRTLDPWEATALDIEIGGRKYFHFDMHMAWNLPWKAGAHSGTERLAWE